MRNLFDELTFILQRLSLASFVDLALVTLIIFAVLLFIRNTRAMVLLRGFLLLYVVISLFTVIFELPAFSWLVRNSVPAILVAIPVIFAPEIRRVLERFGRASTILSGRSRQGAGRDVIQSLAHAAIRLSERRFGALIVLQRLDSLEEYVETGVAMGAQVTPELLLQIFYPNTPLHDGAAIIADDRVIGASCVMPLSSSGVLSESAERRMGLRHRAALGTSEISDAVALVVSEETGAISVAFGGRMIQRLGRERLEGVLRAFYRPVESESVVERFLARYLPFLLPDPPEESEN
ncbi:MAG: diadenylate cyclase CdaA [Anaerolineales bacterium]|nr:diadenylate cyclase CdaA [Anaerolineales bacterium]MCL4258179.1 diadenylate cyclase CdaA [Anaerolineales bacterium]QYK49963.1 MAG: diadenylate cyclase CdaA [Anaerolineales bacterium]